MSGRFRAGTSCPGLDVNQCGTEEYPTTVFNIRQPGYSKLKEKGPSGLSLFTPVTFDMFKVAKKREHIAKSMQLPPLPPHLAKPVNGVPPYFVFNVMLPLYSPSMMGGGNQDGVNTCLVVVWTLTPETREALLDLENASPAVRLLKAFIEDDSPAMREKFKFMCNCFNGADLDMNSIVKKMIVTYNMKPVLGRPQATFFQGDTPNGVPYFEADIDVNRFPYFSTKGLHSALPLFQHIVCDVGITIEGRSEDELPEAMLGVIRCCKMDMAHPTFTLEELLANDAKGLEEEIAANAALVSSGAAAF